MTDFNSSEMAILRRSAAQWQGAFTPKTIGSKLKTCLKQFQVLRDREGRVSGFGREGFTLTPHSANIWGWSEERQRQQQINWRTD